MVGAMQDVTERKHIDDRMRQLTQAVEQSPNGIVITDLAGTIEYANAAFATSSGYAASELVGRNPSFLQSGQTPRETYAGSVAHAGRRPGLARRVRQPAQERRALQRVRDHFAGARGRRHRSPITSASRRT
jgi:PAS domain S-box-containing protein